MSRRVILSLLLVLSPLIGGAALCSAQPSTTDVAAALGSVAQALLALQNAAKPLERDYAGKDRVPVAAALKDLGDRLKALEAAVARTRADKVAGVRALRRSTDEAVQLESAFPVDAASAVQVFPAATAQPLVRSARDMATAFAALFPDAGPVVAGRGVAPPAGTRPTDSAGAALTADQVAALDPAGFFDRSGRHSGSLAGPGSASGFVSRNGPLGATHDAVRATNAVPNGVFPIAAAHHVVGDVPSPFQRDPVAERRLPVFSIPVRTAYQGAVLAAAEQTPVIGPRLTGTLRPDAATTAAAPPAAVPAAPAKQEPPSAASACAAALKGQETFVAMCQAHPTLAPLLAGLVEALREQFGTAEGLIQNLAFMIMGLLMAALSGFGVVAKVVVSLASFAMLAGTLYSLIRQGVSAGLDVHDTADTDVRHAGALKELGKVGGTVVILALMSALGFGVGKIPAGARAMQGMTGLMGTAMSKMGIATGAGALDALVPAQVMAVLTKLFPSSATPDKTAKADPQTPASSQATLDRAGPARSSVAPGSIDSLVVAERKALKEWGSMDPEARVKASAQLVDQAEKSLNAAGYTTHRAPSGDGVKLVIDAMPGRQGVFMRRFRAGQGENAPSFEYDPAALGERDGAGAQFDATTHALQFDAASLSLTDSGSLAIVKHELRHGRQASVLKAGDVNESHGWLAFADEALRRELGIYEADFQIDEVLTYSKQQNDTAGDLRRTLARIETEGTGYLSQGNNRAILESTLKQTDTNYYGPMNMARAFKESSAVILDGLRAGRAVVGKTGESVTHTYRGRDESEAVIVEFLTNERLGPHGLAGVQFPAIRRGRPVMDAEGKPAMDFLAVPLPKGTMTGFESDPEAAKAYILDYLARAGATIETRRAGVLGRQEGVQELAARVRAAASR